MFGLGPTELLVILALALLVLGPSKIPELAASMGKAIRSFRRATQELRDQIEIDDEVRRPFEDLRAALRDEPPPPPPFNPSQLISPPAQAPVPAIPSVSATPAQPEAAPATDDEAAPAPEPAQAPTPGPAALPAHPAAEKGAEPPR